MTGLLVLIWTQTASAESGRPVAVVTAAEVRVQSEPGRHGLLQKTLKRGTTIKIIKRWPGWIQVLHDGEVGFIKEQAQAFKIVSPREAPAARNDLKRPQQQQQLDEYKKRREHISREIEEGQQEVEAYTRKESDIIKHLNQVEQTLNKSIQRTAAIKRDLNKLQSAISDIAASSDRLRAQIRANEEYVAQRLVALYKMNWLGRFHLLASAGSMHEFIQRKAALERILAHDEKIRLALISDQAELEKTLGRLNELKKQKSILADELKNQVRQMSKERTARTRLLADIRSQKALELAAIDALTQASNELDRKINMLNTSITSPAAERKASQLPFSAHKGLLIRPVNGKIISLYGPYKNLKYNITNFRSGIDIEADNGEPVRSVFKGTVLFSSWFKTYGNMIIIDHGKNYYTVYAHLEEAFKVKGDEVETGEVIATVGDAGSMTGTKLYFEVRHHGKPVNPMPWFKKG